MELALYAFDSCPYCQRVYRAMDALDIAYEKRDVTRNPSYREELEEAVGSGTVPVLRIDDGESVRWMPESQDIVRWLYENYGEGQEAPSFSLHQATTFLMWGLLAVSVFFQEYQHILWIAALGIGALRSIRNLWRTRAWTHGAMAAMFLFAVAAVTLHWTGIVSIPWWYGAYALVLVIFLGLVVARLRLARRAR
ncbi:MAG: glutathione S-transferase N-terminal domain-containing protein [Myxococcota bacterium]